MPAITCIKSNARNIELYLKLVAKNLVNYELSYLDETNFSSEQNLLKSTLKLNLLVRSKFKF